MAEKTRISMLMPTELKDYLTNEGDKLGLNFTTMVLIACMEYRKTQQSMEVGGMMKALMEGDKSKLLMANSKELRKMLGGD